MKALREAFILRIGSESLKRFRFLDESGVNLGMTRLYGRADPSQRVVEATSGYSGAHYTLVATLGWTGIQAPFMFEGAMNREIFEAYVDQILLPTLHTGDILILDNLSAHKLPDFEARLAPLGIHILFLPPYSPDLNPIELGWSKVKAALRKAKARTFDALVQALIDAFHAIAPHDILHWFAHCGYFVC